MKYKYIVKNILFFNDIIGTNNFTKRIGICIENSIDFVRTFMAILFNGYTVVGIDLLITKEVMNKIIADNSLDYIFVNDKTDISKIQK